MYKECLFQGTVFRNKMKSIQGKDQKLYTIVQNRTTLVNYDDKRFIFPNPNQATLALGHYKTQNVSAM